MLIFYFVSLCVTRQTETCAYIYYYIYTFYNMALECRSGRHNILGRGKSLVRLVLIVLMNVIFIVCLVLIVANIILLCVSIQLMFHLDHFLLPCAYCWLYYLICLLLFLLFLEQDRESLSCQCFTDKAPCLFFFLLGAGMYRKLGFYLQVAYR